MNWLLVQAHECKLNSRAGIEGTIIQTNSNLPQRVIGYKIDGKSSNTKKNLIVISITGEYFEENEY